MDNSYSFSVSVQKAKADIIKATNTAMLKYQIPAFAADGILSSVLAELRAQTAVDLANECAALTEKNSQAEETQNE